ncbi:hypothetical protein UFOVP567_48 [uncultured Caudovirales phage]|uniref:Uncharacterized protein n=1 Tax=uncultured Caudovirales phage TaxID=2100421 RepID=A0A6J5MZY2_9CAUD|nr:hypothetical protein UFOVP567_48 [uncultured Caudovirales phage]
MTTSLDFRVTSTDPRLAPLLADFVAALLDRSPDFLFEKCKVFGDFAVSRRIRLDEKISAIETVVLTIDNLDDESKPLDLFLSVDRSIRGLPSPLYFFGSAKVLLGLDAPFVSALDEASRVVTSRTDDAVVALLRLQGQSRAGL